MTLLPLTLGPLVASGHALLRSGVRWLVADGQYCEAHKPIGYSNVSLEATGKVTSGFGMLKRLALGADAIYAARPFMLSLGCIQALRCNANVCPAGVATQDPELTAGLVVGDKRKRVAAFHEETIESAAEMLGAMGLSSATELRPWHVMRRTGATTTMHYGELFDWIEPGSLLGDEMPASYARAVNAACAESFAHAC